MDRFSRFFCDPVKVLKFIASVLLCIFVFVYVYFQVIGGADNEIITETSMMISLNDTISCDACVFRDESVINVGGEGHVITLVDEGSRISKGQVVARIFPTEDDALLQDELDKINRRIEILEDSSVGNQFVISDLQKIYDDISEKIFTISKDASAGHLSSALEESENLLVRLNKRDMIVETEFDYSTELETLIEKKKQLETQIENVSKTITAEDSAGYFFAQADGYENVFLIDGVDSVNLDNFKDYLNASPDESLTGSDNIKLVNELVWNLVCSFDAEQKAKLVQGRTYKLTFPDDGNYEMKMKLVKLISETDSTEALAVFRVNELPNDFSYKRFQKAEIVIEKQEGLSVPKTALSERNGVEGVYILVSDVVRFRRVEIITKTDDYYIVNPNAGPYVEIDQKTKEERIIKPLSLYDNIIVSGKDLFDGKIVA